MFAKTADIITRKLKENNTIDDEHYEICRYGLQQGLTIILNIITTLVTGLVLGMFWQAILFTILYIPLRSNAGGYHAKTAIRCYLYSILLMIAVLLAIKYLVIPNFICIIALMISIAEICILAPVEDSNKPLDRTEQTVYRKRTLIITMLEGFLFFISLMLSCGKVTLSVLWVFTLTAIVLLVGKCKNEMLRKSNNAQNQKGKVYHE